MTERIAHCLYGNTNESSSVPSAESWPNTNLSDGGFTQKATATSINKASTLLPLKQFMASFTPLDLSAHLPFKG